MRITRLLQGVAFVVSVPAAIGIAEAQPNPTAIVDQFYPTERLKPDDEAAKRSCFQVYDDTAEGEPNRIVAGYTDYWDAVLRLLSRTPQGAFQVAYESPPTPYLGGSVCDITLLDIDGDGLRDVFLELSSGRGTQGWIFRWGATTLENITPTYSVGRSAESGLSSPRFFDFYHDAALQVVTHGHDRPPPEGERPKRYDLLYRLGPHGYIVSRPVLLIEEFAPGSVGADSFHLVQGSLGPYVLRVANGDRQGQHRATGGRIVVNGVTVVATGQLTDQVEFLEVPLPSQLPDENSIAVHLEGPPDARVTIIVEDTSAVVPPGR